MKSCPAAVLTLLVLVVPAWGQNASADRLREMNRLARDVTVTVSDQAGRPAELAAEPMARYDDPLRRIEDATLWAFGRRGRPVAALKVEIYPMGQGLYGLVSLAPATIRAEAADGWEWSSTRPGLELRPVPNAPSPAANERERLFQMRAIARRFSGAEYEAKGASRFQMRLMPQPLLRYADPGSKLQDGAIFGLAYGVNPDVLIIIESRPIDGSTAPAWQYGLARLGGEKVSVTLDNVEVWTQEPALPVPAVRETYTNRHVPRPDGAER